MKLVLEDEDAVQFFRSLAPGPRKRLRTALEQLRGDWRGRTSELDVKELEGPHAKGLYRLRVGQQCVIFAVRGDVIRVVKIMHRSDGYDWLRDS